MASPLNNPRTEPYVPRPTSPDPGSQGSVTVSLDMEIHTPQGWVRSLTTKPGSKISVEPMFKVVEAFKILDEHGHLYMVPITNVTGIHCGKL